MAMRTLGRVSCKLLGQGSCECSPTTLSTIRFCSPFSATYSSISESRRKKAAAYAIPNISSRFAMNLPQIRYLLTKSDSEEKKTPAKQQVKTVAEKLKKMWKAYGVLAVGTYFGVYVTTLGSLFFALDYDIFNAATVGLDPAYAISMFCDVVENVTGNTHIADYIRENPRVGTFAIAWVMAKFTEPLRLGFTIATVPTIARWFGRRREKLDDNTDDDNKGDDNEHEIKNDKLNKKD